MKTFASALAILILSAGWVAAQDTSNVASRLQPVTSARSSAHDVTGFVAPGTAPALDPESTHAFPNPHPDLKPRAGGVFTDGVKYGTVMISPTAPATYGIGERYLAAPSPTQDVQHESGPAAHRPAAGLKLFSIEF